MQIPITIAEAKAHLRVTHDTEDAYISALILAAIQAVEEYQNRVYYSDDDTAEVEPLKSLEKHAALLMIAQMYENRVPVGQQAAEIPLSFRWLLSLRRKVPA